MDMNDDDNDNGNTSYRVDDTVLCQYSPTSHSPSLHHHSSDHDIDQINYDENYDDDYNQQHPPSPSLSRLGKRQHPSSSSSSSSPRHPPPLPTNTVKPSTSVAQIPPMSSKRPLSSISSRSSSLTSASTPSYYKTTSKRPATATTIKTNTESVQPRPSTSASLLLHRPPTTSRPPTARPTTAASTARTITRSEHEGHYIISIIEGRGVASEIGLAAYDKKSCQILLMQFGDDKSFLGVHSVVGALNPVEIIVSQTAVEPAPSALLASLQDMLAATSTSTSNNNNNNNTIAASSTYNPDNNDRDRVATGNQTHIDTNITPVSRKFFNDTTGLQLLNTYALKDELSNLLLLLSNKYFALAAFAALIKVCEAKGLVGWAPASVRIVYRPLEGALLLDPVTAKNLELVTNIANRKDTTASLFGILKFTKTPMGTRLLRRSILQPLADLDAIHLRLDAVEGLLSNEEMFFGLQNVLKSFVDLDALIANIIHVPIKITLKHSETNLNTIIQLKHVLKLLTPLLQLLAPTVHLHSTLLTQIYQAVSNPSLSTLLEAIQLDINDDVKYAKTGMEIRNQRCYAVKSGVNKLLDVARATYKECTDDVYELVGKYCDMYELPIKVRYNPSQGFFCTLSTDLAIGELPDVFVNVSKQKKQLSFTTLDLKKLNDRINESLTEVYLLSDRTVSNLINKARTHLSSLYNLSENVALLDMLTSFAHYTTLHETIRPEFTNTYALKSCRHPIRETLFVDKFIGNDVYAGSGAEIQVITGPNMSGKSTYVRQIALITILAQIGCFVPCEFASLKLVDRVFTRIGNDDCLEMNASAFMLEMREMAYILRYATENSLVIIDELGRGTSTYDALGVTFALLEELVKKRCIVFFTTHFHELVSTVTKIPGVVSLHLEVEVQVDSANPRLNFKYLVQEGMGSRDMYGITLAQIIGFPEDVVVDAKRVAKFLLEKEQKSRNNAPYLKTIEERQFFHDLASRLCQVQQCSKLSAKETHEFLVELKKDVVVELKRMDLIESDDESNE